MGPAVKESETKGRGKSCLILIYCLLSICRLFSPVTGFALKTCLMSCDVAICVKMKLRAVPRDIPPAVRGFNLSSNRIPKIQVSDFVNLPVLTQLDLNFNEISVIEKGAFVKLTSLKTLILSNNKLVELGEDVFDGLSNLVELRIVSNHIKAVAWTSFRSTKSLKFLDISDNKLHPIGKVRCVLHHLPHLHKLFLKDNGLTSFHSWKLTNKSLELKSLDLSRNPMADLQITADIFPNLTWFNISGFTSKNPLIWNVQNGSYLRGVSTLDISGIQMSFVDVKTLLETVNASLTSLSMNSMKDKLTARIHLSCAVPTMSSLQLRRNKLKSVTSTLFKLCYNVTELDLTENKIHSVCDDAFKSLWSLKILGLGHNKLSSVPGATRNLPSLVKLDLSSNRISKLVCDDFANQTTLEWLNLDGNSVSVLTKCIFRDLVRLQVLKLGNNHMSKLHGAFTEHLPNLRQLFLNGNKLTSFKRGEFSGLRSLRNLLLHGNKIDTLENGSFIGLTNLTDLLLQNNHITGSEINKGCFNDLVNLKRLNLRHNHINYENSSALTQAPFSQLSRLETLALPSQRCRLKTHLPCNFLQGLRNLLVFNIKNIRLLSLHKDMFTYTPRLQQLNIDTNNLKHLHPDLFSPIQDLKSLYISRTSLPSLDFLIHANLTKLEFLKARQNNYSVISEEIIKSVPALVYADFQWNSFTCDCNNAWFLHWAKDNNQTQVFDAYNFECSYPAHLKGMKLLDLNVSSCSVDIEFILFIFTACAILLIMVVSFTYHFLRWHLVYAYYLFLALLFDSQRKNKQGPSQYDAFISYNTHDEPWVIKELLPKLEGEQGWRLCLHHRDFEPGKPIIENITDAIYRSRKTICVISRRYLESEWCSREIQVASFRLYDEQKDVLILVFLEDVPTSQLSPYYRMRKLLKKQTYLSWPRAEEHTELFWEKLRQALRTKEGDDGEDNLLNNMGDRHSLI
ncbi:toll-like receptor 13 [Solea senegalensis]|uniref:Toll-like receptor 13 n=1 Tax=Solea senegalensis TaxID=28829 RepID=A0AAV6T6U8_SOLSE|nr:toll-like receptor 22 isoform X1 [Solea senegalensis]KAG7524997.1 toll-like receptor 13 [Solea senegalensis]